MKYAIALLIAALFVGLAHAQIGLPWPGGVAAPPLVGCASTGVFDLNNVCNDIYLLTGSL